MVSDAPLGNYHLPNFGVASGEKPKLSEKAIKYSYFFQLNIGMRHCSSYR